VAARILPEAVARLVARGARADALLVALGPAIAGERYQVERGVSEQVAASLGVALPPAEAARLAWLQERGVLAPDGEPGRDRLDIRAAARLQLQQLGVPAERISTCPLCTVAEPLLFHSWRRDQVKAVQWSGIVSQV
jgi:copper oxidase (laccase) domain-containing protein